VHQARNTPQTSKRSDHMDSPVGLPQGKVTIEYEEGSRIVRIDAMCGEQ
jgi:hypothetical protein